MVGEHKQEGAKGEEDVSMEDILQSIRRIIADEDETPAPAAQNGAEAVASDVLELTDMIEEAPAPAPIAAKPDDVLAKIDTMLAPTAAPEAANAKPAPIAVAQPAKEVAMPAPSIASDESLLSATTTEAVVHTIHKLDEALEPALPQISSPVFASGNTVETMVMDMLRPMMKSWLDANLPVIVERIVEREVRKLIR